ncbi:MAG: nuclear transport factor 2 family protein [Burkholderiaceae bacterium]
MLANTNTIARLYNAFARLDAAEMAQCYAPEAQFDDPAFSLQGREAIGGMWGMLCGATQASIQKHGPEVWRLDFSGVQADSRSGRAHWEAHYRFSSTGRKVHNIIDAEFVFNAQHLITRHQDTFSFWRWARQALGVPGLLLGWSPMLRSQVRATAASNLRKFMAKRAGSAAPANGTGAKP